MEPNLLNDATKFDVGYLFHLYLSTTVSIDYLHLLFVATHVQLLIIQTHYYN